MSSIVITLNGGSSSIKFAAWEIPEPSATSSSEPARILKGQLDSLDAGNAFHAAQQIAAKLRTAVEPRCIVALAHRIVHGGPEYRTAQAITPRMIQDLSAVRAFDPTHWPVEMAVLEAFRDFRTNLPQFACFDTEFHRDLPFEARCLPIPRRYCDQGVFAYGFHGISYQYLLDRLEQSAGRKTVEGRVIMAHLGSGASMAAVWNGRCIDTTMSFTPSGGIPMSTRCGDLDPSVLLYLMREEGLGAEEIDELLNRRSGLLGISGVSSDMRVLLEKESEDPRASDAVTLFCYRAKKALGGLVAALGGLDTLVFSAGIGEHAPEIRARICAGMQWLGLRLDKARNESNHPIISSEDSRVRVRVIPTDEELQMAKITSRLLKDFPTSTRGNR